MNNPSMNINTETTSWMNEADMDGDDIELHAEGLLLKHSDYFFRIWCYTRQLFK
jgi:hypothetical protein